MLDFAEQRMLDTLENAPQEEQDRLTEWAATLSLADLRHALQQQYPKYASYFTENRVRNVMKAYLKQRTQDDTQAEEQAHDTGPLEPVQAVPMQRPRTLNLFKWLNPLNWIPKGEPPTGGEREQADSPRASSPAPAPEQTIVRQGEPVEEEDDFHRQRREIEQFSESYMPMGKRILHWTARLVGYVLPFLAVAGVGSDLGAFYSPGLGAFSSYTLAFGVEMAIAALTIMLGSAMASKDRSTSHYVKLSLTFLAWLILSTGSALSLYVMASSVMSTSIGGTLFYVTIGWRVASVACFDAASVCILFWTGRSLANYLDEMHKKMHAITQVNEAELSIQRAQQSARLRQQEDAAYMRSRESHEAFTRQLQEIANQAILSSARANLSVRAISEDNGSAYKGLPSGVPDGQAGRQSYQLNDAAPATPRDSARTLKSASVDLDSVLPALMKSHPDWSKARLAKAINVSPRTITRWMEKQHS